GVRLDLLKPDVLAAFLDALPLEDRVAYRPDQTFAGGQAALDPLGGPRPFHLAEEALDPPPAGALAGLAGARQHDHELIAAVPVGLDDEVGRPPDDAAEHDQRLHQQGYRIGLGGRFDGADDATAQAVERLFRRRVWPGQRLGGDGRFAPKRRADPQPV